MRLLHRMSIHVHALLPIFAFVFLLGFAGCGKEEHRTVAAVTEVRWASFPITLKADNILRDRGAAEEDLEAAVRFWEKKAGKTLFTLGTWPTGQAPFTGASSDPDELLENTIYLLNPWPYDGRIAGKTIVHSTGPTVEKAVIFINSDTPLCSGECDREGDNLKTSRRKLLAHELGHLIGFAHVQDRGNIMYPEILPGGSLKNLTIDESLLKHLTLSE